MAAENHVGLAHGGVSGRARRHCRGCDVDRREPHRVSATDPNPSGNRGDPRLPARPSRHPSKRARLQPRQSDRCALHDRAARVHRGDDLGGANHLNAKRKRRERAARLHEPGAR